jgi:hypothetical protein
MQLVLCSPPAAGRVAQYREHAAQRKQATNRQGRWNIDKPAHAADHQYHQTDLPNFNMIVNQ